LIDNDKKAVNVGTCRTWVVVSSRLHRDRLKKNKKFFVLQCQSFFAFGDRGWAAIWIVTQHRPMGIAPWASPACLIVAQKRIRSRSLAPKFEFKFEFLEIPATMPSQVPAC
jgi:hypothetical protein